jgi:hypothetical protein
MKQMGMTSFEANNYTFKDGSKVIIPEHVVGARVKGEIALEGNKIYFLHNTAGYCNGARPTNMREYEYSWLFTKGSSCWKNLIPEKAAYDFYEIF